MSEPNWDRTPWNAAPGELYGDREEQDLEDYEDEGEYCPVCGFWPFKVLCAGCGYDEESD